MSNVVKIGENVVTASEAQADLVDMLEKLLEDAKAGVIIGVAFAAVLDQPDKVFVVRTGWDSASGTKHVLHSGIALLEHRFAEGIINK